jgi:hypothetical protein
VINKTGLFDPRYFLYYEEVDHCRAVKQDGWKVRYYPNTTVTHIGGESAGSAGALNAGRQLSELEAESEWLYLRKHYGVSGVVAATTLNAIACCLKVTSAMVRRRSWRRARSELARFRIRASLLLRTRFGSCAHPLRPSLMPESEVSQGCSRMQYGAVVIGRNEGDRLKSCIGSLSSSSIVVYVDSGSIDSSTDWARDQGCDVLDLDPVCRLRLHVLGMRVSLGFSNSVPRLSLFNSSMETASSIESGRKPPGTSSNLTQIAP